MEIMSLRKNIFFTGRAATAIYLILDTLMHEKEVILPSNICYAAIYPVIYSKNKPVFVDVNPKTGNASFEDITKKITEKTGAIIFPYMYGNVSKDIIKLKEYCKNNNIILIEDCASSMGAKIEDSDVGTFGDYAIFSTGHAKIVDVKNGGFLVTDNSINDIIKKYSELNFFNDNISKKQDEFSIEYRKLRNIGDDSKITDFFAKDYRDLFLYQIEDEFVQKIKSEMLKLKEINHERKEKYDLFIQNLDQSDEFEILDFQEGSNPWRFTILVKNQNKRKELIQKLLSEKLFVSDWYPCIGKNFSDESYPNSDKMEQEILNFSLTDEPENILKTCTIINKYFN